MELRAAKGAVKEIEEKLAEVEKKEADLKAVFEKLREERDGVRGGNGLRGKIVKARENVRELEGERRERLEELKEGQQPFAEARQADRKKRAAFEKANPGKRYAPAKTGESAAEREAREQKVVKPLRERFEAAKKAEDEARQELAALIREQEESQSGGKTQTLSLPELVEECNVAYQAWRQCVSEKAWQPLREALRKAKSDERWWQQDVDWYRKKCIREEAIEEENEA